MIVYGSEYESAQRYAEYMGYRLAEAVHSYKERFKSYERILYIGSLYNNTVTGLDWFFRRNQGFRDFYLITVGIFPPTPEERESRFALLQGQIPEEHYDPGKIFFLPGKLNPGKLKLEHKMIYRGMKNQLLSLDTRRQSQEYFLAHYGQIVDGYDESQADFFVEFFKKLKEQ
ncbi:MAG: flavodoxin domain-containing protein [Tissierellia bacterium]|nr:flavodoxin domain-containing protein [Tissierellia bacterium]